MTIDELRVGDPPEAWAAAGYSVDDDHTCRIGSVRVRLVGHEAGKGILAWSLRGVPEGALASGSLDGLATAASSAAPAAPASHPNGARNIDHVVLLTPDLARTTAAVEALGLAVRRERDRDAHGAPMRQVFFRLGEVILEVVGQRDAAGEGAARFFGIAVTVDDLDATAQLLGPQLGAAKEAVQERRRIATLRHRDLGMSVATAFMSPTAR